MRLILTIMLNFLALQAYAQEDVPPAVPPPIVKAHALPLPATKKVQVKQSSKKLVQEKVVAIPAPKPENPVTSIRRGLYVLELFSSQACTFCPKADAMMKAYIDQSYMIALSCHVDYFDVKEGALSLPICSARQNVYESSLNIGTKYIPQMVVNGRYNATGYLSAEIAAVFKQVRPHPIVPISVEQVAGGLYSAPLPDIEVGQYNIWLFVYEQPKDVTVKEGGNVGKTLTYYNLVSKAGFLGSWNGQAKELKFDAKLGGNSKGFALLVQNEDNNDIVLGAKVE